MIRAEFTDWTRDGLLRQAAFKGIELDRDPATVVREEAMPAARVVQKAPSANRRPSKRPAAGDPTAVRHGREGTEADASKEAWPPAEMDLTPASRAELKALDEMEREGHWTVAGHEVRVTNLDKVLIPAEGDHAAVTKRDLLRYYVTIGPTMLPHLAGRGLNLQRFPDGIGQDGLLAEGRAGPRAEVGRAAGATPGTRARRTTWWSTRSPPWPGWRRRRRWSCIPGRRAPSRRTSPTFALIDVDPGDDTTWEEVLTLTRLYRTALEHLGVIGLPKTTGKRGLQVWVPVRRGYRFDETRDWVEQLSLMVGRLVPDLVSWEWAKRARKGRARLDFTQNAVNKTLVAPYSVRPSSGAPVSAPIRWEELDDPAISSGPLDHSDPWRAPQEGGRPVRTRHRAGAGAAFAVIRMARKTRRGGRPRGQAPWRVTPPRGAGVGP